MCYVPKQKPDIAYYAECDICGSFHRHDWNGDCREDTARFTSEKLDEKHGTYGWQLECFAELEWVEDEDDTLKVAA
jgi:hypothetical protein